MFRISLLLIILSGFLSAQELSWISLTDDEETYSIPSYNYQGTIYVSLKHLADGLGVTSTSSDADKIVTIYCTIQYLGIDD